MSDKEIEKIKKYLSMFTEDCKRRLDLAIERLRVTDKIESKDNTEVHARKAKTKKEGLKGGDAREDREQKSEDRSKTAAKSAFGG